MRFIYPLAGLLILATHVLAADRIVIADFEGSDYGAWQAMAPHLAAVLLKDENSSTENKPIPFSGDTTCMIKREAGPPMVGRAGCLG
jgi:hypothetical protein